MDCAHCPYKYIPYKVQNHKVLFSPLHDIPFAPRQQVACRLQSILYDSELHFRRVIALVQALEAFQWACIAEFRDAHSQATCLDDTMLRSTIYNIYSEIMLSEQSSDMRSRNVASPYRPAISMEIESRSHVGNTRGGFQSQQATTSPGQAASAASDPGKFSLGIE